MTIYSKVASSFRLDEHRWEVGYPFRLHDSRYKVESRLDYYFSVKFHINTFQLVTLCQVESCIEIPLI